jgi:hypothetical protein
VPRIFRGYSQTAVIPYLTPTPTPNLNLNPS